MEGPKLEIDKRMDRLEQGLRHVAEKALYKEDQEELDKILRGEKSEETKDAS